VRDCTVCQELRNALPTPVEHWPESRLWGRLHIDFAGPFEHKYICVLVDSQSGWLEAKVCNGPTADAAISLIREIFARFGLPDTMVSDNGPAFRSKEWQGYLAQLGVKVMYTAPYSPFQNGVCERRIQWLKSLLLKFTEGTLPIRLVNALAIMRFSPGKDGVSSAVQLLG